MALGSGAAYAGFLLVSDRLLAKVDALVLSALVITGAAVTTTIVATAAGESPATVSGPALGWIVAIALVSTVFAVTAGYAGIERVGPTTASILFTVEPPVTVGLAALVFGESLASGQLAGGALVVSAVLLLTVRRRARSRRPAGAIGAAEPAPG